MTRKLTSRKPSSAGALRLLQDLEGDHLNIIQRRRAEALLLYAQGWSAVEIAANLTVHPNTVYTLLRAFHQQGLDVVANLGRGGAKPRLTTEQRATILRIAEQPPYELGLPQGRWSLANLRDYLIRQHLLKTISREHLRRVLKKGGFDSAEWSASSEAETLGDRQFWLKSAGFGAISHPTEYCCFSMSNRLL